MKTRTTVMASVLAMTSMAGIATGEVIQDVMFLHFGNASAPDIEDQERGYRITKKALSNPPGELSVSANTGRFGNVIRAGRKTNQVGTLDSQHVVILPFLMPDLGPGGGFTAAELQVSPNKKDNSPNFHLDLYGLNVATDNISVTTAAYYEDDADPNNTLLQDAFINPDTNAFTNARLRTDDDGDSALLDWLNAMYADGANAGKYVYLRLNPDLTSVPQGDEQTGEYAIRTKNEDTGSNPPFMGIIYSAEAVAIPEPASIMLLAVGGIATLLRRRRM